MTGGMKIGELAALAGVPVPTIRYYERRGLIRPPQRSRSGYRLYARATAKRLMFIKRAQDLGFSLDEAQQLLDLRVDDPASCAAVAERTRAKIQEVRRKIAELERLGGILERLAVACSAREPTTECPVLEMLSEEEGNA